MSNFGPAELPSRRSAARGDRERRAGRQGVRVRPGGGGGARADRHRSRDGSWRRGERPHVSQGHPGRSPRLLGTIAGAPAILGTVVGAAGYNAELAALLIGVGVGAVVQLIQQLVPAMRDDTGRARYPASIGGILAGGAALYATGLLVSA